MAFKVQPGPTIVGPINGNQLVAGSVGATALAVGSVTTNALAAGSVTASALAANSVTANAIAATAITSKTITGCTINGSVFNGTNWVENAAGSFLYSGTPAAGNLIVSIAAASGADSFGNNYVQGVGVYNNSTQVFVQLNNGGVQMGNIVSGSPDVLDAGYLQPGLNGVLDTLALGSPLQGTSLDQALFVLQSGQTNQTTGSALVPHLQAYDTGGPNASDVDFYLSGSLIKTARGGGLYTWQTASMMAGYTNTTLKYRLDPMDNLYVVGEFDQTTGVAGSGAAFVTNATAAQYRPKVAYRVPCAWLSSASVAKGAAVITFNTNGTWSLIWPSSTANGDKFQLSAIIPLGNIT